MGSSVSSHSSTSDESDDENPGGKKMRNEYMGFWMMSFNKIMITNCEKELCWQYCR